MIQAIMLQFIIGPVFLIMWVYDIRCETWTSLRKRLKYPVLLFLGMDLVISSVVILDSLTHFYGNLLSDTSKNLRFLILLNGVLGSVLVPLFDGRGWGVDWSSILFPLIHLIRAFPSFYIFYVWFSKGRNKKIIVAILYVLWVATTIYLCLKYPKIR